jgi:hypothetical protein
VLCITDPEFVPFTDIIVETKYLNGTNPFIDSSYRPPAPEAIISLHFDSFWLSLLQENIAQILT